MSHDDYSFCAKNFWEVLSQSYTHLWLQAASYDWINSAPIWFNCNDLIHSVHKQITL